MDLGWILVDFGGSQPDLYGSWSILGGSWVDPGCTNELARLCARCFCFGSVLANLVPQKIGNENRPRDLPIFLENPCRFLYETLAVFFKNTCRFLLDDASKNLPTKKIGNDFYMSVLRSVSACRFFRRFFLVAKQD